jgi:hypothetical protein
MSAGLVWTIGAGPPASPVPSARRPTFYPESLASRPRRSKEAGRTTGREILWYPAAVYQGKRRRDERGAGSRSSPSSPGLTGRPQYSGGLASGERPTRYHYAPDDAKSNAHASACSTGLAGVRCVAARDSPGQGPGTYLLASRDGCVPEGNEQRRVRRTDQLIHTVWRRYPSEPKRVTTRRIHDDIVLSAPDRRAGPGPPGFPAHAAA